MPSLRQALHRDRTPQHRAKPINATANRCHRWLGAELWRTILTLLCFALITQPFGWLDHTATAQNFQIISLSGAQSSPTEVTLNWTIKNASSIASIRVFRSLQPANEFTLLATLAASVTSYRDTTVLANKQYRYLIRTVSSSGLTSNQSNTISLTLAGASTTTTPSPTSSPTPSPSATPSPTAPPIPVATPPTSGIFVAPDGLAINLGTVGRPLDLVSALSSKSPARPGDTVWLRGGTYKGFFVSELSGTQAAPITVRAYPGEQVIIDCLAGKQSGAILRINGGQTIFRDLEITCSDTNRTLVRPTGLDIYGPNNKFINLVIHDAGNGVGAWVPALEAEIYGCLVFNNGWQAPENDRGHGHGIYMQNDTGIKHVLDNIVFNQYGYGIHAYTERGSIKGFQIDGNTVFGNGSLAYPQSNDEPNLLIGGYRPAEQVSITNNFFYHPFRDIAAINCQLFYDTSTGSRGLTVQNNHFVGGTFPVGIVNWDAVTFTGNTVIGSKEMAISNLPASTPATSYKWDNNTYVTATGAPDAQFTWRINDKGARTTYLEWKKETNFDLQSTYTRLATARPTGTKVEVRPNKYEAGRGNITVFNWDLKNTVEVNLGSTLAMGTRYEIRNVRDWFGAPAASGVYTGQPVSLPMALDGTVAEMTAFVLLPISNGNAQPTPVVTPTPAATPTPTPKPSPTATLKPSPTATPVPSPTATPTPSPTATPTPTPTATPTSTPSPTPTPEQVTSALPLDGEEQKLLELINAQRQQQNLSPLGLSLSLTAASDWASRDMVEKNYLDRLDSKGRTPSLRARAYGFPAEGGLLEEDMAFYAGEYSGASVFARLNTPQRFKTMLNHPYWKNIGIGRFFNTDNARWYWAITFGSYWDVTVPLIGEDTEGRIEGNDSVRTRPPKDALANKHRFSGYGDDGLPYSIVHCDIDTGSQRCWIDPPRQRNLRLGETSAPENLIGSWQVELQLDETGVMHTNYEPFDRTRLVIEIEFFANGRWASRGYRPFQRPMPIESGTWQIVHNEALNEETLTIVRQGTLPRVVLRVHAVPAQLTVFAVDGGRLMKDFLRGWPSDGNALDDPQLIFVPNSP